MVYGFLRETSELAIKAGIDQKTGLPRTGLNEYLKIIFPNTTDWIHDKSIGIEGKRIRPDYRSESLKLIVEFDGLPHYQNPDIIINDKKNTEFYESHGYKVVRIPFFIQLSRNAVKTLFDVDLDFELFDENIPSMGWGRSTPAYFCPLGIERMLDDFSRFPEQYKANIKSLEEIQDTRLSGIKYLK